MCLTYMAAASGSNAIVSISVSIPAWVTNNRHSEYTSIEQCNFEIWSNWTNVYTDTDKN